MTGDSAGRQKFVLVKGMSGLGNRMFCAMTGILYARVTGRRLIVDWSDPAYSDDGSDVFRRFFICPSAGRVEEIPQSSSVFPRIWQDRLRDSVVALRKDYNRRLDARAHRRLADAHLIRRSATRARFQSRTSIEVANLAYEADVAVLWLWTPGLDQLRPHLRGAFGELGQLSSPAIHRQLLARDLLLHPGIQTRVDEFRRAHLASRTVGVHLRLSDRQVRVEAILDTLDALLQQEPDLRIFAASDNVEATERLERRYRDVVTMPHWYPSPGAPQHNNPECPDRMQSGIDALVDLYLLAGCDYLIADGSSSFARLAGLLAETRGAQVLDVRPPPKRATLLERELWRRHAASDSAAAGLVRLSVRAKHPISSFRSRQRSGRRRLTGTRRSPGSGPRRPRSARPVPA